MRMDVLTENVVRQYFVVQSYNGVEWWALDKKFTQQREAVRVRDALLESGNEARVVVVEVIERVSLGTL